MRILLMADVMPEPDSGAAGTEYQTVKALRQLGHQVDCVWADSLPHRIAHGNLHYLLELPVAYRAAMREHMKQKRYDVIHVNQPHGYLAAKALATCDQRVVFIHRSHGLELLVERELARWREVYPSGEKQSSGRAWARRLMAMLLARRGRSIAKYAHGHIVSASNCARFLTDVLGVSADRIAVIPQAAPDAYVETPAREMTQARAKRLLYIGQYAFIKAPMVLAEVINRIVERDDEISVTWVTESSAHPMVSELLSEKARSRATLRGWMSQQELIDVYDSHGIFLFPSFFEGFGKVFIEAMARGLCVIAADSSGAKDVIRHHEDGLLVPAGDASAMVAACLGVLESECTARVLGERAANRSRQYTWERVAKETVAFYENRLEVSGLTESG